LVRHRSGDRLANPPRRVGTELEAAAVLELVDGPHQPRVPLLDQIQEREAAVAILLGDRHDQPQIAFAQFALGLLVVRVNAVQHADAVAEGGRRLLTRGHDLPPLLEQPSPGFPVLFGSAQPFDLRFDLVQSAEELLEQADAVLDPLRPQAEFLDQTHGATATTGQRLPRLTATPLRGALAQRRLPVVLVPTQQYRQRPQVVRQATEDLFFLQVVGNRNLNRTIERQLATMHFAERFEGFHQHVVVFQQLRPEPAACFFDPLGQFDFLTAGQQRDLAHLRQIHSHRVVRPRFAVIKPRQQFVGTLQLHFAITRPRGGYGDDVVVIIIYRQLTKTVFHVRRTQRVVFEVIQKRFVQGLHSLTVLESNRFILCPAADSVQAYHASEATSRAQPNWKKVAVLAIPTSR